MVTRLATIMCCIVMAAYAAIVVRDWRAPDGWVVDDKGGIQFIDHLSLWTAGRLARDGRAVEAYDIRKHADAMQRVMGHAESEWLPFAYPPTMLVPLWLTAGLPYLTSIIAWGVITTLLLAVAGAIIIGRWQGAAWTCVCVPVFWNFAAGQSGALVSALLGGGLALLPRHPRTAGALFGLLTIKPHLALLLPVALLAAGQRRALAAAAASAMALALLSVALLGVGPWLAFLPALSKFGAFMLSAGNETAYKLQSLYGLLFALGLPSRLALVAQSCLVACLAILIWGLWRRPGDYQLKAGALAAAAAMTSPYFFSYDLVLLAVAQAFLLRWALQREVASRDLMVITSVNMLVTLIASLHVPIGFAASAVMLYAMVERTLSGKVRLPALRLGAAV